MTDAARPAAALVTGAGGGIGRAICTKLAEAGYAIVGLDINGDAAAATCEEIRASGGNAMAVQADLTKLEDISRALDEAERQVGPVSVLVNNAGALSIGPFEDIAESEWDKLMDVNVKAPFLLTPEYARRIAKDVSVVHVTDDPQAGEAMREEWQRLKLDVPLIVIESPYREVVGPLVNYIEQLHDVKGGPTISVVVPEFVPAHLYELLLHNQTALRLKLALWTHPDVVVINVPYHLGR